MTTQMKDNMTNIKKLTLAVDIDGTSGDYEGALRDYVGNAHNIPLEKRLEMMPLVTDYAMGSNGWHKMGTTEEFLALHSQAVEDGMFERMVPYENVSEVLWRLHNKGHFVRVVTARFLKAGDRYRVMETTAKWLDKVEIPVDDAAFTARKTEVIADVYIDDAPKNIIELTEAGRTVIIYDHVYNRHLEGLRATNWLEVEEIINRLAAE